MAKRQVTRTRKDKEGDITKLCNPDEPWLDRFKADAIRDIEYGVHTYYVLWDVVSRTNIHVVDDPKKGKYLRTDRDNTSRNNLGDLPNC